ncbi:MAG TPA: c-type cytochrome domain-containing protein [Ignavibacteriaceae bacterium]|nr:c-type cytochrome domain-containing protein [Ignavibacteriaceae bacterium]
MKIIFSILLVLAFAIIITYTGCKDTVTAADIDKVVIPDSNVSYSKYIQPVFNVKCNSSNCHADASQAGGIDLTTCSNTTADPSVVFPGEPDNSRLVWSIEGIGNFPMPPPGYPTLTQNQIKGVRTWIKEGAQCN